MVSTPPIAPRDNLLAIQTEKQAPDNKVEFDGMDDLACFRVPDFHEPIGSCCDNTLTIRAKHAADAQTPRETLGVRSPVSEGIVPLLHPRRLQTPLLEGHRVSIPPATNLQLVCCPG